jgi:hypothetical protein
MIRIETVVVSVGYGDLLAATLPENLPLLDNVVVMTSPDDAETIRVCRQHSVHYVATNDHKRDGPFNKGRLIQRGFDQMGCHDWLLHLDADIVLPRKFRNLVQVAHLDESTIYGADRCNLVGWDEWQRLKQCVGVWDNHAHENAHWFHPKFLVGSRWVSSIHGYVPIGFFQLFHGSAMVEGGYHIRKYPQRHGDAARADVQFGLQWDRRQRQVVPEVVVLHLDSGSSAIGSNWEGRTTPRFGPEPAPAVVGFRPPHHRPEPVRPPHGEPDRPSPIAPPHRPPVIPPDPIRPPPHVPPDPIRPPS